LAGTPTTLNAMPPRKSIGCHLTKAVYRAWPCHWEDFFFRPLR